MGPNVANFEFDGLEDELAKEAKGSIGKALSKALLSDENFIQKSIDEETIDPSDNVVFFLGAGSSVPSNIPPVGGLLDELIMRARKIQNSDINRLVDFCENNEIENIEDVLTAVYLAEYATKNNKVKSLVDHFLYPSENSGEKGLNSPSVSFLNETLQTLFGLLMSTMITADPNRIHEEIIDFTKDRSGDTSIITTNYDGCMDEAILNSDFEVSGLLKESDSMFPEQVSLSELAEDEDSDDRRERNTIELIKMHGSINWTYCESCQQTAAYNLKDLKHSYNNDVISYPVVGICPHCGGRRRPLLIPPISFKLLRYPDLIQLWEGARENIISSDYIIVVGYSFSDSDTYITNMVYGSMIENEDQKLIVVDPSEELVPRIRDELDAYGDINKSRIIQACGPGEEMLEHVLDSLNGKDLDEDLEEIDNAYIKSTD